MQHINKQKPHLQATLFQHIYCSLILVHYKTLHMLNEYTFIQLTQGFHLIEFTITHLSQRGKHMIYFENRFR